ncbi:hypothetical protein GCM10011611_47910 [Aliidongia dinghuensis]|uniref:DUF2269 family protein n=1 Tax=Aliidongia dinghuensis TaxID=1867774 RepID=A0A8J2YZ44_9PROT|nr:hypothetical protein [Aliidongia dinghuensis]GGF35967.1 hypothetical protein GCM10011611_47910 [Aliidongia dinghuensis]
MQAVTIKRNALRALLVLHLLGIAIVIGSRAADLVVYRQTSQAGFQLLALGRDLAGAIGQSLTVPSLALIIVTGISMAFLRYGRRPPIWVWIKASVTVLVLFVAPALVGPSLRAAQEWAHWSADHNQLAPQFEPSAARASLYGAIVFALFLLNISIAVWKPFLSFKFPSLGRSDPGRDRREA